MKVYLEPLADKKFPSQSRSCNDRDASANLHRLIYKYASWHHSPYVFWFNTKGLFALTEHKKEG